MSQKRRAPQEANDGVNALSLVHDDVNMESRQRGAPSGYASSVIFYCDLCRTRHAGSYKWTREWLSAADQARKLSVPEQSLRDKYGWLCIECRTFLWNCEPPERR